MTYLYCSIGVWVAFPLLLALLAMTRSGATFKIQSAGMMNVGIVVQDIAEGRATSGQKVAYGIKEFFKLMFSAKGIVNAFVFGLPVWGVVWLISLAL